MPRSCMAATYASETEADMPSKPGNPTCPVLSRITWPSRSTRGPLGLICGATCLCPKSPMKPECPAGSSGKRSGLPLLAVLQRALPAAQWTPIPTKSANAWPGLALTSAASGEPAPNTVGMSMAVFSRMVLALATAPTSQPARVYGTHGAGAIFPNSLIIVGVVSVGVAGLLGSKSGAVQYAKETPGFVV